MNVKCPKCGKGAPFEGNPFRPFCSERCKLIDLGDWLSERYRMPTRNPDEEEDGDPKPPGESTES